VWTVNAGKELQHFIHSLYTLRHAGVDLGSRHHNCLKKQNLTLLADVKRLNWFFLYTRYRVWSTGEIMSAFNTYFILLHFRFTNHSRFIVVWASMGALKTWPSCDIHFFVHQQGWGPCILADTLSNTGMNLEQDLWLWSLLQSLRRPSVTMITISNILLVTIIDQLVFIPSSGWWPISWVMT
jgi:hypothetical protein